MVTCEYGHAFAVGCEEYPRSSRHHMRLVWAALALGHQALCVLIRVLLTQVGVRSGSDPMQTAAPFQTRVMRLTNPNDEERLISYMV